MHAVHCPNEVDRVKLSESGKQRCWLLDFENCSSKFFFIILWENLKKIIGEIFLEFFGTS